MTLILDISIFCAIVAVKAVDPLVVALLFGTYLYGRYLSVLAVYVDI